MGKVLEARIHAKVENYLPNFLLVRQLEKVLTLGYITKIKGELLLKKERSETDYSKYITELKQEYPQKVIKNRYIGYSVNRGKKLSIIIPTHNTHKYINQCLKSLNLDYLEDSIEVIIVDDGSDKQFRSVLETWQHRYPSLRLVFQPNRGISATRNHGIEASRGKYLTFLDSDDLINMDTLRLGLGRVMREKLDLISFDYQKFNDNEEQNVVQQPDNRSLLKTVTGYVWGKIYKSSLWQDVRFPEGLDFEDTIIPFLTVPLVKKGVVEHEVLVKYRSNQLGFTKQSAGKLLNIDTLYILKWLLSEQKRLNIDMTDELIHYYIFQLTNMLVRRSAYLSEEKQLGLFGLAQLYLNDILSEHDKNMEYSKLEKDLIRAMKSNQFEHWRLLSQLY